MAESEDAYLERVLPAQSPVHPSRGRSLTPRYETTHSERWEITFDATVLAGLVSDRPATTAEAIIIERLTQVLYAAGVNAPNVRARKVARSPFRGDWAQWDEYAAGDIVEHREHFWEAQDANMNRMPGKAHRATGPGRPDYWELYDISRLPEPDRLFLPTPTLPELTAGDQDDDIVDAEVVDELRHAVDPRSPNFTFCGEGIAGLDTSPDSASPWCAECLHDVERPR